LEVAGRRQPRPGHIDPNRLFAGAKTRPAALEAFRIVCRPKFEPKGSVK